MIRLLKRRDAPPVGVAAPFPPEPVLRMPVPQPAPPRPGNLPDACPDTTRYRDPRPRQVRQVGLPWLATEAARLDALATAGGDLTAHRDVLEDR